MKLLVSLLAVFFTYSIGYAGLYECRLQFNERIPIKTVEFKPERLFRCLEGVPADLIVSENVFNPQFDHHPEWHCAGFATEEQIHHLDYYLKKDYAPIYFNFSTDCQLGTKTSCPFTYKSKAFEGSRVDLYLEILSADESNGETWHEVHSRGLKHDDQSFELSIGLERSFSGSEREFHPSASATIHFLAEQKKIAQTFILRYARMDFVILRSKAELICELLEK